MRARPRLHTMDTPPNVENAAKDFWRPRHHHHHHYQHHETLGDRNPRDPNLQDLLRRHLDRLVDPGHYQRPREQFHGGRRWNPAAGSTGCAIAVSGFTMQTQSARRCAGERGGAHLLEVLASAPVTITRVSRGSERRRTRSSQRREPSARRAPLARSRFFSAPSSTSLAAAYMNHSARLACRYPWLKITKQESFCLLRKTRLQK